MNEKYWAERQAEQQINLLDKHTRDYEKRLAVEYRNCLRKVKEQLVDLYDDILVDSKNGTLLVSDLYRYNRYYELINTLNSNLKKLGYAEIKITEDELMKMYMATTDLVANTFSMSVGYDMNLAKKCLDAVWCSDGKHWSDRIWDNKTKLQEVIEKGLIDCVSRGASKRDLIAELRQQMNSSYYNADRIAKTELSYVQNQATKDKYLEAGVKRYKFLSAHDERTCDVCGELDGKIFYLRDARVGENYPPVHPNCRSTVLAVIE